MDSRSLDYSSHKSGKKEYISKALSPAITSSQAR